MEDFSDVTDLEKRVQRIEERIGLGAAEAAAPRLPHPAWPFVLGSAAVAFGYLGVAYPQHYYQFLFSGLLLVLLYHRSFLLPSRGLWRWPQIVVNFLLLCLLFKLLIGGGISHPFDWIKTPSIAKAAHSGQESWYSRFVPDITIQWQAIPKLSEWSIDITKIQTFLLILTFAGALFRFEPFTSVTALALLIISLPNYLHYDWDWVVLFLIVGSVSIYLQSKASATPRGR